jgi:hypothetical protein
MKRRKLRWNVILDEGGQALTEFVIVIPIVLLFFFAMVQYFSIVQATQLGNYAAFVAARVYAVSESCDTNAAAEAQQAASLALAPIARPVVNEIGGDTAFGSDVNQIESLLQSIGNTTTLGSDILDYGEGYVMAQEVRFNGDLLGGSVTCSLTNYNSGPQQVNVTINYPQPIYMPGLESLWKFLGGTNIYAATSSQAAGLTGVPAKLLPFYAGDSSVQSDAQELSQYDSGLGSSVQSFLSGLPTVLLPYINVQSECSIGYSAWSGTPRMPDSIADAVSSGTNEQALLDQTAKDRTTYSNAVEVATTACENETNALAALVVAQRAADADPTNGQLQAQLAQARQTYSGFYGSNTTAQAGLSGPENALNGDLGQFPSVGGNSIPTVGGVDCPYCPPPMFAP